MKIEKLFKKAEEFFGMEKEEQQKNEKKSKKLLSSIEERIDLVKEKIRDSSNKEKIKYLKKELTVLKILKIDCEKVS